MDTQSLQQKIDSIDQDIADKQAKIALLKDGIVMDKKLRKIYVEGLKKLKEKYADQSDQEAVDQE